MRELPSDVVAYKKTPVFTKQSVPSGLLKAHRTKKGTWGRIVVLQGRLEYQIEEPVEEVLVLVAGQVGIIEPAMSHAVRPMGDVEFYVEFLK